MGRDRGKKKRKSLSNVDKLFDLLFVSIVLRKSNAKEKKVSTSFQCTHSWDYYSFIFINFLISLTIEEPHTPKCKRTFALC